ncbi:chemotaxis protein CheW [Noviherbaspirillum aridicola]|uniref:Chemotaxis protein CheW n=1 Tax=Noviherbaspirillum aridicola TaxID=2849687 RepID=A0ABQ4Q706_9BURK|nr:chemotaxis protein CheW [Noviherbaspirillum aridicola]GIZ52832.1 chemotaxis protein CheW [Noviherbaspirillum aridicola]
MQQASPPAKADPAHAHEYLSFRIGREEYGIHILQVQELRGYEKVTRIAGAPDYLQGVINLRGIIVPIIDLRIRLGEASPVYDQFTVVIILSLPGRVVGMVVDSVSDVVSLTSEQIRPAPAMSGAFSTEHLIGLGTLDERMVILVDIEKMLSGEEAGWIDSASALKVAA